MKHNFEARRDLYIAELEDAGVFDTNKYGIDTETSHRVMENKDDIQCLEDAVKVVIMGLFESGLLITKPLKLILGSSVRDVNWSDKKQQFMSIYLRLESPLSSIVTNDKLP